MANAAQTIAELASALKEYPVDAASVQLWVRGHLLYLQDFYVGDGPPTSFGYPKLISFTLTRATENMGTELTFRMIDTDFTLLKDILDPVYEWVPDIEYRFGWSEIKSPKRRAIIKDMVPGEISRTGIEIELTCTDLGTMTGNTNTSKKSSEGRTIVEEIQRIADKNRWELTIEPCDIIETEDGRSKTDKKHRQKVYYQRGMTDLQYVTHLVKDARLTKGGGRPKVQMFEGYESSHLYVGPYKEAQEVKVQRSYVVQTQNMGKVISFSPEIQSLNQKGIIVSEVVSHDRETMAPIVEATGQKSFTGSPVEGNKMPGDPRAGGRTFNKPPRSRSEVLSGLENYYDAISKQVQTATLEVIGDPEIELNKPIAIAVPTPWGVLYPTSGIWTITEITDSIEGGSYTTTLNLMRRGADVGVRMEGDKIILPTAQKAKK